LESDSLSFARSRLWNDDEGEAERIDMKSVRFWGSGLRPMPLREQGPATKGLLSDFAFVTLNP